MKSATSFFVSVLLLALFVTGCADSTGQESEFYEPGIIENDTAKKRKKRDKEEAKWAEHRENFGERRSSSRSSRDTDWGSDGESEWDREEFERNMEQLKEELNGLVDLDQLEHELRSIEREFEGRHKEEGFEHLEDAMESLGEALSEVGTALSSGVKVETVDYEKLKEVLPGRIRGYEKKNFSGDKVSVFGINLSVFEQEYEQEKGNGSLTITVIDLGSLANAAVAGLDWLDMDIKSESASGFEQTTTIDGYPAFEECERSSRNESCSLHLVVEDRFVVQIEGDEMSIKDIRGVMDNMDIRKLSTLDE